MIIKFISLILFLSINMLEDINFRNYRINLIDVFCYRLVYSQIYAIYNCLAQLHSIQILYPIFLILINIPFYTIMYLIYYCTHFDMFDKWFDLQIVSPKSYATSGKAQKQEVDIMSSSKALRRLFRKAQKQEGYIFYVSEQSSTTFFRRNKIPKYENN